MSKPGTALQKKEDHVIRTLRQHLSDEELVGVLGSSGDDRAIQLLELMLDPNYAQYNFASLCKKADLNLPTIIDLFRKHNLQQAILATARQIPDVIRDLATDSRSVMEVCGMCGGLGRVKKVYEPDEEMPADKRKRYRKCPACEGKKRLRRPGDKSSREMFLNLVGAIQDKGGMNLTVNVPVGNGGQVTSHQDELLEAERIIDIGGESPTEIVVPAPEPAPQPEPKAAEMTGHASDVGVWPVEGDDSAILTE